MSQQKYAGFSIRQIVGFLSIVGSLITFAVAVRSSNVVGMIIAIALSAIGALSEIAPIYMAKK